MGSVTITYLGNSRTITEVTKVEYIRDLSLIVFGVFAEEDLPEAWVPTTTYGNGKLEMDLSNGDDIEVKVE